MALETIPQSYEEHHDSVMANFDSEIDEQVAEILQQEKKFAQYGGWNFCGYVWWNRRRKKWSCQVMHYHQHTMTVHANTLREIKEQVSDEYGGD